MKRVAPSGWKTLPLDKIAVITMGQSPESKFYNNDGEGLPFFQGKAEFGKLFPQVRQFCSQPKKIVQPNEILLSIRAPVGPTNLAKVESCIGRGLAGIKPLSGIDHKFLLYQFKSLESWLSNQGTGSTFQAINKDFLSSLEFLIPSEATQHKIVAKLDSLLARVESCRAHLDRAAAAIKRFRQSILNAAVTGKLSEYFRKNSEYYNTEAGFQIPCGWKLLKIEDVAEVKGGKRLPNGEKLIAEITEHPYIRAGQLKNGSVNPDGQLYLTDGAHFQISNYTVSSGDVYITIVGACIGDAGIIPESYDGANLTENAAKLCNFKRSLKSEYLSCWLRSQYLQDSIRQEVKSGAQGKLALKRIRSLPIPLPSIEEQREIVYKVNSLFGFSDQIESQIASAGERIDNLTASILAKAFRGELV